MKLDKKFVEKTDENIGEIQMIIRDLNELAADDGKMSQDELLLLNNIKKNLEEYSELLEKIVEDNEITLEEFNSMKSFESKMIEEAESKALQDGRLSDDEKAILNKLKSLLEEIGTLKFE